MISKFNWWWAPEGLGLSSNELTNTNLQFKYTWFSEYLSTFLTLIYILKSWSIFQSWHHFDILTYFFYWWPTFLLMTYFSHLTYFWVIDPLFMVDLIFYMLTYFCILELLSNLMWPDFEFLVNFSNVLRIISKMSSRLIVCLLITVSVMDAKCKCMVAGNQQDIIKVIFI